ncbi:MAG: hypothetical protein RIF32_06025, partial [Leptospirales bacterium]
RDAARARFVAVIDLPEPPFWFATAMIAVCSIFADFIILSDPTELLDYVASSGLIFFGQILCEFPRLDGGESMGLAPGRGDDVVTPFPEQVCQGGPLRAIGSRQPQPCPNDVVTPPLAAVVCLFLPKN